MDDPAATPQERVGKADGRNVQITINTLSPTAVAHTSPTEILLNYNFKF